MSDWYILHGLAIISVVLLSFGAGYYTCLIKNKKIGISLKGRPYT